jgi:hypothetical protein
MPLAGNPAGGQGERKFVVDRFTGWPVSTREQAGPTVRGGEVVVDVPALRPRMRLGRARPLQFALAL